MGIMTEMQARIEELELENAQLRAYKAECENQKPVTHQYKSTTGEWCNFANDRHRDATIDSEAWQIRELYAHPIPSDRARITEQDAMSILLEWDSYRAERSASGVTPAHFKKWLHLVGRALLDKLNADREQVVMMPKEMTIDRAKDFILADEKKELLRFAQGFNCCRDAMLSASPADSEFDECPASGESCYYETINEVLQCKYCGKPHADIEGEQK